MWFSPIQPFLKLGYMWVFVQLDSDYSLFHSLPPWFRLFRVNKGQHAFPFLLSVPSLPVSCQISMGQIYLVSSLGTTTQYLYFVNSIPVVPFYSGANSPQRCTSGSETFRIHHCRNPAEYVENFNMGLSANSACCFSIQYRRFYRDVLPVL